MWCIAVPDWPYPGSSALVPRFSVIHALGHYKLLSKLKKEKTEREKRKLTLPCVNKFGPGSIVLTSIYPRKTKLIPALQHPTLIPQFMINHTIHQNAQLPLL